MTIYIFTHSYPYTKKGEVFLNGEMDIARQLGIAGDIRFVPLRKEADVSNSVLSSEFHVENCLFGQSLLKDIFLCFRMVFMFYFWKIPSHFSANISSNKGLVKSLVQGLVQGFKYFYAALKVADWIREHKNEIKKEDILYTYWCNYNALGMAIAKKKKWLKEDVICISRAHRYDVYEEKVGVYFPYREFSLKVLDRIYPCSQSGIDFFKERYPYIADKLRLSHLGIVDVLNSSNSANWEKVKKSESEIRILSCSYVSSVKRLPLLLEFVKELSGRLDKKVIWHHFGGGEDFKNLQQTVELVVKDVNSLEVVLHGSLDNAKIRYIYITEYFDAFVNVSESEGLPVSLMEAISAGIPIIATDVGGNREIALNETGVLIPADPHYEDFEKAFMLIQQKGSDLRKSARNFFEHNFLADYNYREFYKDMLSLLSNQKGDC